MVEMSEEEKRKMEERERKKAEVRQRLEAAAGAKPAKGKGFMTPQRKKKLRTLLRKKAAEELKKEQERKAEERRRIIGERCGAPRNVDAANEANLHIIVREYYEKILKCESEKYDLEYDCRSKEFKIHELSGQVNDLRGKFVKPSLKKVSKFDKYFMTMKIKSDSSACDFRSQLKSVKKDVMKEEAKEKPQWALGSKKEGAEEEEE